MGSRSGGTQTVTQTAQPPAFALPGLTGGTQATIDLFNVGGPQQFPGQTVVPFSPQTNLALNLAQNRAVEGSPTTDAASTFLQDILGSRFNDLTGSLFDQAATATQSRLASEFAGAGRDLGASRAARADELSQLATRIFGDQQGRQLQAAALAPSLAAQDFFNIGQLERVGGRVEDQARQIIADQVSRFGFEQERPEANLDRFLQRIGLVTGVGGGTTSSQQPFFTNPIAGGLGGALTGAQIASLGGPIGTGVGAGIGGLLGLLGAF